MRHYLVRPFDVLYFRGNKAFDFGEWYSEGVFPPYPSTFQGFVRTAILKKQKLVTSSGDLIDEGDASQLVGDDKSLPFEINGPYLFHLSQFYLTMPFDIMPFDRDTDKAKQINLSEQGFLTDMGFKLNYADFREKAKYLHWSKKFCSLEQLNNYRLKGELEKSSLDFEEEAEIVFIEDRIGIQLDYGDNNSKKKQAKKSMFYMTPYMRFDESARLYFNINLDDPDLNEVDNKLGSEGRGAMCEILTGQEMKLEMNDDFFQEIISSDRKMFKLILLQPGLFEHGWLPFASEEQLVDGYKVLNYQGMRLKLIYAKTGGIKKISGMSILQSGLKPMLNAVPAGAVYYFEILNPDGDTANLLKGLDGKKIPLSNEFYTNMGFNQVVIGKVF